MNWNTVFTQERAVLRLSTIFMLAMFIFINMYPKCRDRIQRTPNEVSATGQLSTAETSNTTRASCVCHGDLLLKDYVAKEQLDDVSRRRTEEYRKHLKRTKSDLDLLLFAPPNSPLQYPIQGFTVRPLQKTLIPGLTVHAKETQVCKACLSVTRGNLAVHDLDEGDVVEGQGKRLLCITANDPSHLNGLLARVTYVSTVYRVKAGDLALFSFHQHKATFPITIRQPTLPVLYDPGEDVNSQVTIATKTFLRYPQLNLLIGSIRSFYKDIKIIIADDNFETEKVQDSNFEQYFMPPAQGWFAGRNLAVSQVTTKYMLWVDDDFLFTEKTRIEDLVEVMEAMAELDVVGGSVDNNQFYFALAYEEGDEEEGGCLNRLSGLIHQPVPGFPSCSFATGVVNFFLARTDSLRKVGFDPLLKRVAHSEFFMDGLGELLVASCNHVTINHQQKTQDNNVKYNTFRVQTKVDSNAKLALHFFKNHLKCLHYG